MLPGSLLVSLDVVVFTHVHRDLLLFIHIARSQVSKRTVVSTQAYLLLYTRRHSSEAPVTTGRVPSGLGAGQPAMGAAKKDSSCAACRASAAAAAGETPDIKDTPRKV